jgi:hypothetical protein
LLLLTGLVYRQVLLGRRVFWGSDLSNYFFPLHQQLGRGLRQLDLSSLLWNPSVKTGYPLLAEGQAGVFYPLHWLTLSLLPPLASMNVCLVLSALATALASYAFLRNLQLSRAGSLLGGVSFAFGGFAAGHLPHLSVVEALPWLPLLLWLVDAACRRADPLGWLAVGFAWALQLFTGHPQVPVMTLFLAAAYATFRVLSREQGTIAERGRRAVVAVAILVAAGCGAAAVHLGPLLELGLSSERVAAHVRYEAAVAYSLPLRHLLTAVWPFAFGAPRDYRGPWSFAELSFYPGELALFLSLATLRLGWRRPEVRFFGVLAGIALLCALGDATPFYRLVNLLPGLGAFRAPARFVVLLDLAMAVLAGCGLDLLCEPSPRARRWRQGLWAAAVLPAAALGLLASDRWAVSMLLGGAAWLAAAPWLSQRVWAALAVALLALDLGAYAARVHEPSLVAPEIAGARDSLFEQVASPPGHFRVYTCPGDEPWIQESNRALVYGFDDVGGYNAISILHQRRYEEAFWWRSQGPRVLLSLANVRYVVDLWQGIQSPSRRHADVTFLASHPLAAIGGAGPRSLSYRPPLNSIREVAFVSRLRETEGLPEGSEVARLLVADGSGQERDVPLLSGVETAEELVNGASKVEVAYLGPSQPDGVESALFYGRVRFDPPLPVVQLQLRYVAPRGRLDLHGLSFVEPSGRVVPLSPFMEEGYHVVRREPRGTLYENEGALPRASVAHAVRRAAGTGRALEELLAPGFPAAGAVVLEDAAAPEPTGAGPSAARIDVYRPTEVRVTAEMHGDGYLVLSDTDYPGWRASVDGRPAPILRANAAFRAVYVPSGTHQVVFLYRPLGLFVGALASFGTLALAGLAWWRRRPGRGQAH